MITIYKYLLVAILFGVIMSCGRIADQFGNSPADLEGKTYIGTLSSDNSKKIFVSLFHNRYGTVSMPVSIGFGNQPVFSSSNCFWQIKSDSLIFQEATKDGEPSEKNRFGYYLEIENDSTINLKNNDVSYELKKIISPRKPLPNSIALGKASDSYFENQTFVAVDVKSDNFLVDMFMSSSIDLVFSFDEDSHGSASGSLFKLPGTGMSMLSIPEEIFWGVQEDMLYIQTAYPTSLGETTIYKIISKDSNELVLRSESSKQGTIRLRRQKSPY